jgi:hypothetical protein
MVEKKTVSFSLHGLIIVGNANLIYTIIRKRQVFFALSNLSTDTQTITKLNAKSLPSKINSDKSENKQNVFKSNHDGETISNKDNTLQTTAGLINNPMMTTLPETPC